MEGKVLSSPDDYLKKRFQTEKVFLVFIFQKIFDEFTPEQKLPLFKKMQKILPPQKGVNARIQHELDKVADYAKQKEAST